MANVTTCPACKVPLDAARVNAAQPAPCHACLNPMLALWFPAIQQPHEDAAAIASRTSLPLDTDEASCFYHPAKRAAIVCQTCGRFLCSLCDIELAGEHLCSNCIEAGKRKATLNTIEKNRTLYDEMALAVSTLPILFWPATLLTAPGTLFIVVRYWKKPLSIIPRTKTKYILAAIFASLQILGWSVAAYHLLT